MTRDEPLFPTVLTAEISGDMNGASPADAAALFSEAISSIAKGSSAKGGVIGHIKSNLRSSEEMVSASCTTEDGNVRLRYGLGSPVGKYVVVMNAIVYGIGFQELRGIAEKGFSRLPGVDTCVWHKEGKCDDPGCSDPECRDPSHRRVVELS